MEFFSYINSVYINTHWNLHNQINQLDKFVARVVSRGRTVGEKIQESLIVANLYSGATHCKLCWRVGLINAVCV